MAGIGIKDVGIEGESVFNVDEVASQGQGVLIGRVVGCGVGLGVGVGCAEGEVVGGERSPAVAEIDLVEGKVQEAKSDWAQERDRRRKRTNRAFFMS